MKEIEPFLFISSVRIVSLPSSLGLPSTGSWQDLKDHMREAGDVCYADVYRDCSGVVEYVSEDDMMYAVRTLDDSKFKSHEVVYKLVPVCCGQNNLGVSFQFPHACL